MLLLVIIAFAVRVIGDSRDVSDKGLLQLLAGPVPFSFPPNCTKARKPPNSSFCATGVLDIGLNWVLNFDTYIFDVFEPNKTVLLGFNATINRGMPKRLDIRTGGCAVPAYYDVLPGLFPNVLQVATKLCTSGGGPGKYDTSTKGYSAEFTVFGDTGMYSYGKRTAWPFFPFNATGHAYINPHFDVGLNVRIVRHSGIPKQLEVTTNFTNIITSVNGSVLTWHVFSGFTYDIYNPGPGHVTFINKTFVDKTFQIKPPS
ncbi:hypothetical protein FOL47_010781 [Perkinsus chesapeaki]|uniref:Uncharacterized protein n=1 Tax=Perkinsus chesapeaki TaxID=330153 RepID=A0A7J6MP19_PERCH|nr:hypothetical protein FOL47_010781 [Perkinsus chesapeaki]